MNKNGGRRREYGTKLGYLVIEELEKGGSQSRGRNGVGKCGWRFSREKVVKCGPKFARLLTAGRDECSEVFAARGCNHL